MELVDTTRSGYHSVQKKKRNMYIDLLATNQRYLADLLRGACDVSRSDWCSVSESISSGAAYVLWENQKFADSVERPLRLGTLYK